MDYLGITKYLTSPRPKKPWWELGPGEWPDTDPDPAEPADEVKGFLDPPGFRSWYAERAAKLGLNPDPDNPEHHYDYRAAFLQGAEPDETGHWPSVFKDSTHPRRYLAGDSSTSPVWSGSGPRFDSETGTWDHPEEQAPSPPRGLLDRVADRMGDLGYGGGEDAKRAALRRALGAFGARLSAGATKEGLGGIGAAVSEGFGAYEGGLAEQRKRRDLEEELRRQTEGDEVQRGYMKAITQQMEGKPAAEAASLRQAIEARKAKVEERRAWLGQQSPEIQKRLGQLVGADDDQWNRYVYESGAPPEPPKPDRISLSEGEEVYERQPDGSMKRVLSRPPRPRSEGGGREPRSFSLSPGEQRFEQQPDGTYKMVVERPKPASEGKPYDQRAEATKIYQEALKDPAHAAYRSGTDNKPDVKATWKAAWEAAGAAAPPAAAPNQAPEANHARNEARDALLRGASPDAVLGELRKIGSVRGYLPIQILESAKAEARKRGWKG